MDQIDDVTKRRHTGSVRGPACRRLHSLGIGRAWQTVRMPNANNDRHAARAAAAAAQAAAEKKRKVKVALTYTGIAAGALALVIVLAVVFKSMDKTQPAATPPKTVATGTTTTVPSGTSAPTTSTSGTPTYSQLYLQTLTNIPQATYDQVGAGTAGKPTATNAAAITQDGKPVVIYVGAEFCPFCAGERWAVVAALSRFGTWSNLNAISSAASDVWPSTSTVSFKSATYSSKYLVFSGTEVQDGNGNPLQTPSARDSAVWTTLGQSSFPFIDIGGAYALAGAQFIPTSMHAGDQHSAPKSWDEIADGLKDPSSTQSQQILGAANIITAQICALTNNQPAAVCSSAGVVAAK